MVAAERVVPRQPVAEHRRLVGEERAARVRSISWLAAEHALRVDHALRRAGRARREEDLGDRCPGPTRGVRVVHRGGRPACARSAAKLVVPRAIRSGMPSAVDGNRSPTSTRGSAPGWRARAIERARPRPRRPGRGRMRAAQTVRPQRAGASRAHQRVGRRDRRVRHAGVHRRERRAARARCCCPRGSRSAARPTGRGRAAPARCGARARARPRRSGAPRAVARRAGEEGAVGRARPPSAQPVGQLAGYGPSACGERTRSRPRRRGRRIASAAASAANAGVPRRRVRHVSGSLAASLARIGVSSRKVRPARARARTSSGAGRQRAPCSRWNAADAVAAPRARPTRSA